MFRSPKLLLAAPAAVTLLLAAAPPVPAQDQRPRPDGFAEAWATAAAHFRAGIDQARIVGGSVAFVRGREVLAADVAGMADLAEGRPVDRDTIYHWASITKTFTGIAIMQLRDRGRLALDDPIVDQVPELRAVHDPFGDVREITIRHLLSHSAGFRGPTWPWGGNEKWHPHEPTEWSQLVAMMPYTAVEFEPGSKFSYSNPGVVFLGRVIEKLSGDDYEVYMDKNVLKPLGMYRSYFDGTPYHLLRHRSNNYQRRPGGAVAAGRRAADASAGAEEPLANGLDFDTGITVSNGGLNAPLGDMVKYLAFLLGDVDPDSDAALVLKRSSLEEMWVAHNRIPGGGAGGGENGQDIGLSFFLMRRNGRQFITHTGGQKAFVSFFYVHPASRTGAVGAFNTSTAGPLMGSLRQQLMDEVSPLFLDR